MIRRTSALSALFALSLAVVGCTSTVPEGAYVAADRTTLTAVRPLLQDHAAEHLDIAPDIADVLDSWELRVKQAEQGVATK